jgi:hypothetical protein
LHPVSTTLQILEHQITAVVWQIWRLVLIVASVLLARHAGLSALDALWISSLVQVVCCLALLGLMVGSIEQVVGRWRGSARSTAVNAAPNLPPPQARQ